MHQHVFFNVTYRFKIDIKIHNLTSMFKFPLKCWRFSSKAFSKHLTMKGVQRCEFFCSHLQLPAFISQIANIWCLMCLLTYWYWLEELSLTWFMHSWGCVVSFASFFFPRSRYHIVHNKSNIVFFIIRIQLPTLHIMFPFSPLAFFRLFSIHVLYQALRDIKNTWLFVNKLCTRNLLLRIESKSNQTPLSFHAFSCVCRGLVVQTD